MWRPRVTDPGLGQEEPLEDSGLLIQNDGWRHGAHCSWTFMARETPAAHGERAEQSIDVNDGSIMTLQATGGYLASG